MKWKNDRWTMVTFGHKNDLKYIYILFYYLTVTQRLYLKSWNFEMEQRLLDNGYFVHKCIFQILEYQVQFTNYEMYIIGLLH